MPFPFCSRRRLGLSTAALLLSVCAATISAEEPEPAKLLGACSTEALHAAPFAEWHEAGLASYKTHPDVLEHLKGLPAETLQGVDVTVFFGTWCGDSRREVPRFLRLLGDMQDAAPAVSLVAVDNEEPLYKRSPGGEEEGLSIFRVPTFIVRRHGHEIGRIVEHPVRSLERDLLAILVGDAPAAAYRSYPSIIAWHEQSLLDDPNVDPYGLAADLRPIVASESELWSVARVLLSRHETDAAVKILQTNCALYPTPSCAVRLAEALRDAGRTDEACKTVDRALERLLSPPHDPAKAAALLALRDETAGKSPGSE